jgi:monoamine oxidase
MSSTHEIMDLAVAGAGVSGLFSAWRLLDHGARQGKPLSVTVFESDDRVGGRLLSVKPPFIHDTYVELGGMRFSKSHRLAHDLIRSLGLAYKELADANPNNVAYLRGKRMKKGDLIDPDCIPYLIDEDLRNPQALQNLMAIAAVRSLGPAFKAVLDIELTLDSLKTITPAQWRAVGEQGTFEGHALHETPLHYVLIRTLGRGAVQLLQDSLGYDSILWTWSAADGFPWNLADFASDVPHYHLVDGFAALPARLKDKVTALGGEVRLNTRITAIEEQMLPDGQPGVAITTVDALGVETRQLARKLILAMPRRSIELLSHKGPLFERAQAQFKPLLESVSPIPLFKIALCYETCWWEKVVGEGSNGKSVTDLPMRQVYYWKVNPDDQQGVVMIYDGGLAKSYWEQLDNTTGTKRRAALSERVPGVPLWSDYAASPRIIFEAHRQLLELHGLEADEVPTPFASACISWSRDPFGGGSHFWNQGVRSHDVAEKILQPVPDWPVYICGECWSHEQGWVEGALQTAEAMLQRHFGLPALHDTELV